MQWCQVWGPHADSLKTSSLHEFDGEPRKSTWRAGINECGGNQNRLQSSQEGTLRSLGAEGGSCAQGLDSSLLIYHSLPQQHNGGFRHLQAPQPCAAWLQETSRNRPSSVSHPKAIGPGKGTIRSVFPCFPKQIRYSSEGPATKSGLRNPPTENIFIGLSCGADQCGFN